MQKKFVFWVFVIRQLVLSGLVIFSAFVLWKQDFTEFKHLFIIFLFCLLFCIYLAVGNFRHLKKLSRERSRGDK